MSRSCVLMFSGGRDSTVAAIRLATTFEHLTLVTITSDHLIGIEAVHERLVELPDIVPHADWIHVSQPQINVLDADHTTCLPCHSAYATVGLRVAYDIGSSDLAFGYVRYQNDWPEQTPGAIALLRSELERVRVRLHVPAYDIDTKEEARAILARTGLSEGALEQKCVLQKLHRELSDEDLSSRLQIWSDGLRTLFLSPPTLKLLDRRSW